MRILLVEDDATIAEFVARGLREAGFAVDAARDGAEGLQLAASQSYDVAVVDVMLPARDGLSLIEEVRRRGSTMPVLILSARRAVDDRVKGLQTGGDDYLTKPFAFSELLARVQALIRSVHRRRGADAAGRRRPRASTCLTREVGRAGSELDLRPREFALLEYLMRNPGRVVSKTMILSHVWDYSFDPRTNVVDVLVHRLREKIDKDFEPKLLQTVRGVGYVLQAGLSACVRRSRCAWPSGTPGCSWSAPPASSALTYHLLARSLERRDHDLVLSTLTELRLAVQAGGLEALRRGLDAGRRPEATQASSSGSWGPAATPSSSSLPNGWAELASAPSDAVARTGILEWSELPGRSKGAALEVASLRLVDGTLFQVGRSSAAEGRDTRAIPRSPGGDAHLCPARRSDRRGALHPFRASAPP